MDINNVVAISCRTNTGEVFEVPVREFFGLQTAQNNLGVGVVPKSDGKTFIASNVIEGPSGQLTFKSYKSETSFTGIPVGILAFDATGRVITIPFQQNQTPPKTTTIEGSSSNSQSTANKLPIWTDNNGSLGDSDIIRDNDSYSVGGTMPFWKWDVHQGSVNITQSSVSDGYRLNGKLVLSYDPDTGEITIGNATYNTTNIQHLKSHSVAFNTSPSGTTMAPGVLRWNDTDGTLEFGMKGGNVTQQIGQELPILVKHADNAGLTEGTVVYVVGSDGANKTVRLAKADAEITSVNTFGVMTESASGGGKAFCTTFGVVRDINTSALTEGGTIYLSPTVAGGMTTTKPYAPYHLVTLGFCIRSHATVGSIFVSIHNGFEINEIHDIAIGTLANNNLLAYESATSLWKNKTYAELGLFPTPTGLTTNYVPKWNGTAFIDSSITESGAVVTVPNVLISGLTASQLIATDVSKNLVSLNTSTYPNLTEISYVKGVTSAIQTQINGKEATITAGTATQYWRGDKTWQEFGETGWLLNGNVLTAASSIGSTTNYDVSVIRNSVTKALFGATVTDFDAATYNFKNGGTTYATLNSVGLGLGIVPSAYKLHVKAGNANQLSIDNSGEQYTEIDFSNNGSVKSVLYFDNTSSQFVVRTLGSSSIGFETNLTRRLTIGGTGNVGINTTTLSDVLTISTSGSGSGVKIIGYESSNFINLNNLLSTDNRTFRLIAGVTSLGYNGFSIFDTQANATRFVIDNSGNVVIGADSTSEKFEIVGTSKTTNLKITSGAALGYVALSDANGQVVWTNPSSLNPWAGNWNANTNTPTLADGTGTYGVWYHVETAGTVNLGSGSITYAVGDRVIYNGTIWVKQTQNYSLNVATTSVLGGIKQGTGLSIDGSGVASVVSLTTARTISATSDISWSVSFDGSANVTADATLATVNSNVGTFRSVTVNAKGLVTAATNPTTLAGYGITDVYTKTESDARYVDLTTNQTSIDGTKGFVKDIVINGINAGQGLVDGLSNTAFGYGTLDAVTTGSNNTGVGYSALSLVTTATENTGIGRLSLGLSVTNGYNTGVGANTLASVATGSYNVALGSRAGWHYYSAGGPTPTLTSSSNSIYLGYYSRPLANGQTNQIVIGYNGVGSGSNTVTIGNSDNVGNYFFGTLKYGTLLKPNDVAGTSGQFLGTSGTQDVWTTLTTSHISDLSSYTGFDTRYFTETESDTRFVALGGSYANPTWITELAWSKLSGVPSTFTPSAHTLDSHSNVTITSNSSGEILKWNGSAWINNTPDEADLVDKTNTQTIGGTKTFSNTITAGTTATVTLGNIGFFAGIANSGSATGTIVRGTTYNKLQVGTSDRLVVYDAGVRISAFGTSYTTAPTERLQVEGNIRYNTLLKPNNVAGTNKQVLSTSGTQDIWSTLNFTYLSDVDITSLTGGDILMYDNTTSKWRNQNPSIALLLQIDNISGLQTALDDKQPLDADLTAIAALTGTSGLLRKTNTNTWTLDTSTFLTGNQTITLSGVITGSGTTAITTAIADGALTIAKTSGLQSALDAKQDILPSGDNGQFLVRDSTGAVNFMDLKIRPIGLSFERIGVGNTDNYLGEHPYFLLKDKRHIQISRITDSTKQFNAGMFKKSNDGFIEQVGGSLTIRATSGIYLTDLAAPNRLLSMVTIDSFGRLSVGSIQGGGSVQASLTTNQVGYGVNNTLSGSSNLTYLSDRYFHFTNSSSNFNIGVDGMEGFAESINGNLKLQARGDYGVVVDDGYFKVNDLAGSGTRMVVASSTGVLSTQTIPSGGGVPDLNATQIAFGNGSNLMTSSSNFVYDSGSLVLTNTTAANTNVIRINGSDGYDKNIFFSEVGLTNNGAFVGYRAGVGGSPDPTMLVLQTIDSNNIMGGIAIHRQNGHVYIGLSPNSKAWNSAELNYNKLFVDGNMGVGGNEIILSGTSFKLSLSDAFAGAYTPSNGDKCTLTYDSSKAAFVLQKMNTRLASALDGSETFLIL